MGGGAKRRVSCYCPSAAVLLADLSVLSFLKLLHYGVFFLLYKEYN